jgi:hypothetical protein
VPYAGHSRLVALARYSGEHTDVLAHVASAHVVILCRLVQMRRGEEVLRGDDEGKK